MRRRTKGLHALYREDPIQADRLLWDRETDPVSRRGFLRRSSLLAMSAALGASIPFARHMPSGLIPAALAQELGSNVRKIFSTRHPTGGAFAALKDDGAVVTWGNASNGGDSSKVAASLTDNVVEIIATETAFAARVPVI